MTALGALVSPFESSASSPRWWSEPPGAVAYPAPLARAIDRALPRRAAGTPPRFANRLSLEPSPYLKRHADDAVDWWPWSVEAFATARRLDRPVFLSIGYLACGGCHAMETECFEDESLARHLNERYVAILVDREERPEVEAVYLRTLRSLGLEPGWPMTLWLLPDGRAFFAGTYYPAEDSANGPGLRSLVERLAKRFRENRAPLEAAAASLALAAAADDGPTGDSLAPPAPPTVSATEQATRQVVSELERRFDWQHGGLAGAPKFPNDVPVRLLLAHDALVGDARARSMAVRTLEVLQASALRDPLSGGFHRYATDEAWRLPHYEKMLADNALLTLAFLDGFRATGRQDFAAVARETLDFLLDELADPAGGFHAALDAVSQDGVEGGSYTWTREEIDRVLGAEAAIFLQDYRLTPDGRGRGVLAPAERLAQSSDDRIASLRTRLLAARRQRPRPAVDDQLVLGPNGLAIAALARAGWLLEEPRFVDAASKAAGRFLAGRRSGALPRILRAGSPPATLADLAALCGGLLDLLEATGEVRWFEAARLLEKEIAAKFERTGTGGFLSSEGIGVPLGERQPDLDDSLAPSGNALHLDNLWRLAAFTGDIALRRRATLAVEASASRWRRAPGRAADFLRAARIAERPPHEIVIAVPRYPREAEPFLRVLRVRLLPQAVSIVVPQERAAAVSRVVPLVTGKLPLRGQATAYLCRGFVCERPTSDAEEFARQLAKAAALAPPINPGT